MASIDLGIFDSELLLGHATLRRYWERWYGGGGGRAGWRSGLRALEGWILENALGTLGVGRRGRVMRHWAGALNCSHDSVVVAVMCGVGFAMCSSWFARRDDNKMAARKKLL